jgi:F0F1-type ATP synthase membrane subunit b/b'
MSFDKTVDNAANGLKKAGADVKDSLNEAGHRANAEGEQAKRDVAGDQMTAGQKAGSMLRQGTETIKADVDKTKRDVRDNT